MNGDYNNGQNQNPNGQSNQGQYGSYGQQQYNPQGYGQGYNPQYPYPNSPYNFVPDPQGESARTFGIVSLVCAFFCSLVGLILGVVAMKRAKESIMLLQYESSAAKTGRTCGLIAVILSSIALVSLLIWIIISLAAGVMLFEWLEDFVDAFDY